MPPFTSAHHRSPARRRAASRRWRWRWRGEFDGTVINADSMQVYRELADPDRAARRGRARAACRTGSTACCRGRALLGRRAGAAMARAAIDEAHARRPAADRRRRHRALSARAAAGPGAESRRFPRRSASGACEAPGAAGARRPSMPSSRARDPGDGRAAAAQRPPARPARAWEVLRGDRPLARPMAGDGAGRRQRASIPLSRFVLDPPRATLYAACDAGSPPWSEAARWTRSAALLARTSIPACRP